MPLMPYAQSNAGNVFPAAVPKRDHFKKLAANTVIHKVPDPRQIEASHQGINTRELNLGTDAWFLRQQGKSSL